MNEKTETLSTVAVDPLVMRIGAILTYVDHGTRRPCGQTVGADGAGTYCKIFLGPIDRANEAARNLVREIDGREPGRITDICIVTAENGYYGSPITITDLGA
jgi:hypothetical protein